MNLKKFPLTRRLRFFPQPLNIKINLPIEPPEQRKMVSKPDIPEPEEEDGYSYGLDGLTVGGYHRERPHRLEQLLLPENITNAFARQKAEEDAQSIVKPDWVEAQLMHYGIKFDSRLFPSKKRALLVRAVEFNRCRKVPMSVIDIEKYLRNEFKSKKRAYEKALQEFNQSSAEEIQSEPAAITSPTGDADDKAVIVKEPVFWDWRYSANTEKWRKRANHIPAALPVERIAVISQPRVEGQVNHLVFQTPAKEQKPEEAEMDNASRMQQLEEADWTRLMQEHQMLVAQAHSQGTATGFSTYDIEGTYFVTCDKMASHPAGKPDNYNMRLRIMESDRDGLIGMFDFGLVDGIMLLDEDPENLALRVARHEQKINSEHQSHEDISDKPRWSKKRKAEVIEEVTRLRKIHRGKATSGTVFLQWRGVETRGGVLQPDPRNEHVGQLNYWHNQSFSFEGSAAFGFVGKKVRFQGYKIGLLGGSATRSWDEYAVPAD